MKHIVVLGDGMPNEPVEQLGGKTPLAYAWTPVMDELASKGQMGMVQNVPAARLPICWCWAMIPKQTSPADLPWRL